MNKNIAVNRYKEVLKVDVIANTDADFLATHVPFTNIQVTERLTPDIEVYDEDKNKKYSEEELLNNIVYSDDNDHFNLVLGSSGSGKSHLIRWLKAMFETRRPDNEAILFVRRNDNTLKGTIKQLLEIPEIQNLPNKETYKKLASASVSVPEEELKTIIYSNYITKIKNDNETITDDNHKINNMYRKCLVALLNNAIFERRMMSEDGPIERIYSRFAESNTVQEDDPIGFVSSDFELDYNFKNELVISGADKDAQKMVDKILKDEEWPEKIANYLNSFSEKVIQMCSGFEPGDFRQVFVEIRQELRKQGKNLTLFIEDITAFTGVNEALLEALMTPHTGDYEKDHMCRINSIIGSTKGYYKDSFRDNYKQRVSKFILIPNDIFKNNSAGLLDFFAKYLNTISLESEAVNAWVKSGAEIKSYPVHQVTLGKYWDSYEISSGISINLFPFTKNAIKTLYSKLNDDQRTPRLLIKNILEPYILEALDNLEKFPSRYVETNSDSFGLRNIINSHSEIAEETRIRLFRFMNVWGDGTNNVQGDESKTVGGINVNVYKELGLPIVEGEKISSELPVKKKEDFVVKHDDNDKKPISKPYDKEINGAMSEIDKWIEDKEYKLNISTVGYYKYISEARRDINDYLYDRIGWLSEGISRHLYLMYKNTSGKFLVSFDKQKGNTDALILLPATTETRTIVEGFIKYRVEGNGSWFFANSADYLLSIEIWVSNIKKDLIFAMSHFNDTKSNYYEYATACELVKKIVYGDCRNYKKISGIDPGIMFENPDRQPEESDSHSKTWQQFQAYLDNVDFSDAVKQYYNLPMGNASGVIELDYVNYEKSFKNILKNNVLYSESDYQQGDPFGKRKNYGKTLRDVADKTHRVIEEELIEINKYLSNIGNEIEIKDITESDIDDLCEDADDFYQAAKKANIGLFSDYSKLIKRCRNNSSKIVRAIKNIDLVEKEETEINKLLLLSSGPLKEIKYLYELILCLHRDIEEVNKEIDSKGNIDISTKNTDVLIYVELLEDSDKRAKEVLNNNVEG